MGTLEPIKGEVEYTSDTTGVDKAIQALEALSKQSADVAKALGSMDSRKASDGLEAAGKSADSLGDKVEKSADRIRKLSQAFTEIKDFGAATVGKALQEYERFSTSMGQTATLLPEVRDNLGEAEQATLALSRSLGVDATSAADAFYQTLSSSVKGASDMAGALGFMESAGKAAVAGNIDLKTAVDGMGTALNAWGMSADDATKASDIMFTAVARGKTTFGEFSSSLFNAAPLAAATGVSLENVAGATATLTKTGTPTTVVMTQLKAVLTELNKPSAGVATALQAMADKGLIAENTGKALIEAYGGSLPDALQALRDNAEEAGVSYGALFGSVEASSAVLGLTGTQLEIAQQDLEAMGNSAGMTADAYQTMSETFGFQSNQLRSSVQSVFIEIGKTLGTVLVPFMQKLNDIIAAGLEKWNSLGEGTRRFIVTFGALVAVIGPAVMGFMSLYGQLQAASKGAGLLQGAMKLLSASMLTNPVTAVVLAISAAVAALVVGIQGLSEAVKDQQAALQGTGAGLEEYAAAVERADETAGGLAGVIGGIRDAVRDSGLADHSADIRRSADAWLEYSVGVDQSVLKTRTYQQAKAELDRQLQAGTITVEQYKQGLLDAADAASVAAGMGRVLTQEQQKVAQSFTDSQTALLARTGAVGEALAKDEEYQQKVAALAELVGQGKLAADDAAQAMSGYVNARSSQIASDLEAAQAAAEASGAVYTYSDSFSALTAAGSQWVADQQAITEGMGKLQETLEGNVRKSLEGLWQARQDYSKNLADAAAADAEAQTKAQGEVAASAAEHANKIAELEGKRGKEGKDDTYRAKIDEQIAAENERWNTLNAIATTGTQSQTEKVRAAYAEQVQITKEALAQTIVDFVNGQVLLGQTSEETAKQIYSTLRGAFPDVEVFSPVQDAYVGLMAGISGATKGSEADIARLPGLIQAIPDTMEQSYAEANATLDSWGQDYNLLAQTADTSATTIIAKDGEVASSTAARGSAVLGQNESQRGSYVELEGTVQDVTGTVLAENANTVASATGRAAGVSSALATEQGALDQTASVSQSANRGIQADYQQTAGTARNMADVTVASTGRIQGGLDTLASGVRTSAQTIGTEYEGAGIRFGAAQQKMLSDISISDTAFLTSGNNARTYAGQVSQAGDTIEGALGGGADAAVDTGRAADRGLGDAADAATTAAGKAVDLREQLEALPKEVTIPVVLDGVEDAIAGALRLRQYLTGMPERLDITITTQHTPLDDATRQTPSLYLFHWIEDGVNWANSNPVVITSQYVSGSELLTPGSNGLAWLDAYQKLLQQVADNPIEISPRFADATEPYLQAGADRNKLLYQEQLESLLATIERFGSANVDPETMAELARAMAAGDLERSYQKAREALEQLQDAEDTRYENEIKRLEDLRDTELERLEAQLEGVERGSNDEERLQKQLDERKKYYEDLLEAERTRHDTASNDLDAEAEALARYYERIGDYEDELDERRQARLQAVEDYYEDLEDYEKQLNDEIERLLDEREQDAEDAYNAELARIQDLEDAEQDRYERAKSALQSQIDTIKDEQEAADRLLSGMARDLKRLELDLNLDQTKDEIDAIKDAMSDLPSATERDPRKRSKKFGLEDVGGDDTKAAIEKALAEGRVTDSQQRKLLEDLLKGKKVGGQELREALEGIEANLTAQLEDGEKLLDQKRRELEYAKLQAEIDKQARDDKLADLDEIQKGIEQDHKDELERIAEERATAKQKLEDDKQAIEDLRTLEEARHKARLEQIAQEAAVQKALIEGKTADQIKAEIEAAIRQAEQARQEAARLLEELERQRGTAVTPTPTPPPAPPPAPPAPPIGPPIEPPINPPVGRGAMPTGQQDTAGLEDEVEQGVVSGLLAAVRELASTAPAAPRVDPLTAALTSSAGIVSPASISVYNSFYGDIYVGEVQELQTLLRSTLGGP